MDLETAFVTVWNGNAAIAAAGMANKLFPGHAPEETAAPWAVYEQQGGAPVMTMSGPVNLADFHMTLTLVGTSRAQVLAVRNTVMAPAGLGGLNGFAGYVGGNLLQLQAIILDDVTTAYDPPQSGDDIGRHECTLDLRIWYHT